MKKLINFLKTFQIHGFLVHPRNGGVGISWCLSVFNGWYYLNLDLLFFCVQFELGNFLELDTAAEADSWLSND